MRYRTANLSDVPTLAALNAQLIVDEGHRNRMSLDELAQRMTDWLVAGEYEAILFERGHAYAGDDVVGEPCGYVLFRREPDYVHVRQFFVCRDARRVGIGRTAIGWLRANAWREAPRIRVEALVDKLPGLTFWRAVGFHDYCLTLETR